MPDQCLAPILHRVKTRSRFCTPNEMIDSVRENIEKILNTRLLIPYSYVLRPFSAESSRLLNDSLVNFGIADIQSLNLGDETLEKRFCKSVKLAIQRFEQRLGYVTVEMSNSSRDRIANIEVQGMLLVPPFEKDIHFESGLEPATQKFFVS